MGSAFLWSLLVFFSTFFAHGQIDRTLEEQRVALEEAFEQGAPEWFEQETFTGNWGGFRDDLGQRGIFVFGALVQEYLANVSGGISQGGAFNGLVDVGISLDTEGLTQGAWKGGEFFANAFYIFGNSLSLQYVGDLGNVSNINFRNSIRLYNLWFQQKFWGEKARIQFGQLAVDEAFGLTEGGDIFVHSDFGAAPIYSFNIPVPIYAIAGLGVLAQVKPTEFFSFKMAAYGGNPAPDVLGDPSPQPRNLGTQIDDHGIHWGFHDQDGILLFAEIEGKIGQEPTSKILSGTYRLGGFYHTHSFTEFRTGERVEGDSGIYFAADQMIWKKATTPTEDKNPEESPEGLHAFLRISGAPGDRNVLDFASDFGLSYLGLLPSRPHDILALGFSYKHFSNAFSQSLIAEGENRVTSENVLELTYRIQVTPWITLQPDCQYIFQPAGMTTIDDAIVVGLRSEILF